MDDLDHPAQAEPPRTQIPQKSAEHLFAQLLLCLTLSPSVPTSLPGAPHKPLSQALPLGRSEKETAEQNLCVGWVGFWGWLPAALSPRQPFCPASSAVWEDR